jgi:hypothetical protein
MGIHLTSQALSAATSSESECRYGFAEVDDRVITPSSPSTTSTSLRLLIYVTLKEEQG